MKAFSNLPINSNNLLEPLPSKQAVEFPLKSKVFICLSVEDSKYCLESLITSKISFEVMHYIPTTAGVQIPQKNHSITPKNTEVNLINYSRIPVGILETVKEIYNTFIEGKFEVVPPNEAQLASNYGLKLATFKNNFKILYGKPFYQIYMEKRIEYAAKLLLQGYKAVEVSKRIGYGEKSCIKFNKMFQKHFGITPKKYQMSHLGRID